MCDMNVITITGERVALRMIYRVLCIEYPRNDLDLLFCGFIDGRYDPNRECQERFFACTRSKHNMLYTYIMYIIPFPWGVSGGIGMHPSKKQNNMCKLVPIKRTRGVPCL
jgi:hypothetical protein